MKLKTLAILTLLSLSGCASVWADMEQGWNEGQAQGNAFWGGMIQGMAAQDREDTIIEKTRDAQLNSAPQAPLRRPSHQVCLPVYNQWGRQTGCL